MPEQVKAAASPGEGLSRREQIALALTVQLIENRHETDDKKAVDLFYSVLERVETQGQR